MELIRTAAIAGMPVSTPAPVPVRNAARRPRRRAKAPIGKMHAAMPTTKIEMGSVANAGEDESMSPTMAPVA